MMFCTPQKGTEICTPLWRSSVKRAFFESEGSNRPLTPILLKSIAIHLPFVSRYFCKRMPSSWQKVVYTPPICVTIRLPFVSRCFCRSIRVRGRWNTPQKRRERRQKMRPPPERYPQRPPSLPKRQHDQNSLDHGTLKGRDLRWQSDVEVCRLSGEIRANRFAKFFSWWTFWIFFIFSGRGRGRGSLRC